jgi:hypothetical protein
LQAVQIPLANKLKIYKERLIIMNNIFEKIASLLSYCCKTEITTRESNSYITVTTEAQIDVIKSADFYIDYTTFDLSYLWKINFEQIKFYEYEKRYYTYYVFAVKNRFHNTKISNITEMFETYENFDTSYHDDTNDNIFKDFDKVFTLKFRNK